MRSGFWAFVLVFFFLDSEVEQLHFVFIGWWVSSNFCARHVKNLCSAFEGVSLIEVGNRALSKLPNLPMPT